MKYELTENAENIVRKALGFTAEQSLELCMGVSTKHMLVWADDEDGDPFILRLPVTEWPSCVQGLEQAHDAAEARLERVRDNYDHVLGLLKTREEEAHALEDLNGVLSEQLQKAQSDLEAMKHDRDQASPLLNAIDGKIDMLAKLVDDLTAKLRTAERHRDEANALLVKSQHELVNTAANVKTYKQLYRELQSKVNGLASDQPLIDPNQVQHRPAVGKSAVHVLISDRRKTATDHLQP